MKLKFVHIKRKHWFRYFIGALGLSLIIFIIYFKVVTAITPPPVADSPLLDAKVVEAQANLFTLGPNALRLNNYGLWEMVLEGNPFEMGIANGKLTRDLIKIQEDTFVDKIKELIPSRFYLHFLKYFIAWFNRDIDEHIPLEYQQEIYGVSLSAAEGYEYIGDTYNRMLNYHAAHDVGHALQNLALVGCTSFAANMHQPDSSLIIGRNFDFYVSDAFAENKIAIFVKPNKGYPFMYLSWASMIGVVSGMNVEGLTVTLNAAKSDFPLKASTPISILAREILQYASNIDEAIAIAKKRQTFVAESILIGSAHDNKAVIIEKSVSKLDVFERSSDWLVCSNHFQSASFIEDPVNIKHQKESPSLYRQLRCEALLAESELIDPLRGASILRDRKGIEGTDIGMGNEKAMCQLISHHGIIFEPQKLRVWVSTKPYQLGSFLLYDLAEVFKDTEKLEQNLPLYDTNIIIGPDGFVASEAYKNYQVFKRMRHILQQHISDETRIKDETDFMEAFVQMNPNYYQTYVLAGDYFYVHGAMQEASRYYTISLSKEFEKLTDKIRVQQRLTDLSDK